MKTYTVDQVWQTANGWRCTLRHEFGEFGCDSSIASGQSVVIRDGRAVQP